MSERETKVELAPKPAKHRVRRGLGYVGLGLFGSLLSLPYAATHAQAHTYLGPHPTTIDTNSSGLFTADGGPITNIELPVHLPFNIGVTAKLHQPPAELADSGDLPTLVAEYAQLGKGIGENINDVKHQLELDILETSLEFGAATIGLGWLVANNDKLRHAYTVAGEKITHPKAVVAGLACVACAASLTPFSVSATPAFEGDAIFTGTPLAGARLTGAYGPTAEKLISLGLNAYEHNEAFYKQVKGNVATALAEQEPLMPYANDPSIVTGIFETDNHCNLNMIPVMTQFATALHANMIIDGGDTTLGGTSVEIICATSLSKSKPAYTAIIRVKGNHDSTVILAAEQKAGDTVLTDKPATIDGITFLGGSDPRQSGVGLGTTDPSGETIAELGSKLADEACAIEKDGKPKLDVLLVHDPDAAQATIDSNCANTVLAGHWHKRVGPDIYNQVMRYVGDTAGGAKPGGITIGPLNQQAGLAVFQWSKLTGKIVAYRSLSVETDASVVFPAATTYPENYSLTPEILPRGQALPGVKNSSPQPTAPH